MPDIYQLSHIHQWIANFDAAETAIWRHVAAQFSEVLGHRFNFAQTAYAYRLTAQLGMLEMVRNRWRGDLLAPETMEAVADMLRSDSALLPSLLASPFMLARNDD